MSIRTSPKQVHRLNVQSEMLSTLPIVEKARLKEEKWRAKYLSNNLISQDIVSSSDSVVGTTLQSSSPTKAPTYAVPNMSDAEYYILMLIGIIGLLCGMYAADFVFEDPRGVRLPYDPSVGFLSLIEEFEQRSANFQDLVYKSNMMHLKKNGFVKD